ncbi:hypothetical protein [Paludibacter jiangxiensis]|uniref:Uncharacterized protein n=1 Tax=Paludibacter jiangxiensis TaxID=681398 RepID=A0A170YKF5_9BACT|nr:hypothetical protein [Paludibacter jiangxiensis]GAT61874.1 hypothetical protein PJIAN_1461 [Paludibacter jiangxiensis]
MNRKPVHNRHLAQWRVARLIEYSTSPGWRRFSGSVTCAHTKLSWKQKY